MTFEHFLAYWGHHLIMLAIWLILVLSLNLINGSCGLFSLGHQGFWMAGAYAAGAVIKYLPHGEGANWAGILLSFPAAILAAAIFGFLVGLPCLRLRGDYLAIATLAFGEILRNLVQNCDFLGGSYALNFKSATIGVGSDSKIPKYILFLVVSWAAAALVALMLRNLMRSSHGRAIQSIRDDERAAELLGVNLTKYKVFVFVVGAGLAGLAGAVFANYTGFVTYKDFDFNQGVLMVVMVVLGGMGNMTGVCIACAVLHFMPILLALWLPDTQITVFYDPTLHRDNPLASHWVTSDIKGLWQVFYSFLLIVVVLLRPKGILNGIEFKLPWTARKLKER